MQRSVLAMAGLVAITVGATVLTACSGGAGGTQRIGTSTSSATIKVHGHMSLTDGINAHGRLSAGNPCTGGANGYGDISEGAEVVISDDTGKTLAITQLGAGTVTQGLDCQFLFSASVPAGKRFYGVTVTHRGTVKEAESDLGDVALSLG